MSASTHFRPQVEKPGEISCSDERIRQGIYSVQLFPLSGNFLGVAFENVTDRNRSDRPARKRGTLPLLIQGVQEYAIFPLGSPWPGC